jgi:3'-phosphoadenosine 5'-phosphosulfate sulfotransferase (PAPS reductase)/FAD synthetase
MRTVVWFSAGAASAVATKLTLRETEATVAYIDPGSEHADNARFIADCETWFGQPVERLRSQRYADAVLRLSRPLDKREGRG